MKKYPKIEVTSKPVGQKHKAVAKTKVPCGAIVMVTREEPGGWVAELYAKRQCKGDADIHVHEHGCGEIKD